MKYVRNIEIRRMVIISAVSTVVLSGTALFISLHAAIYAFCVCLLFSVGNFLYTVKRYRKIESMSTDIDRILHGAESQVFSDYSEGELSVLQSEIRKLTVRLSEQTENLQKDKIYLSDSIADISHQIRTPLTSLNIIVSMLSDENIPKEKRNEMLAEMQRLLHKIEWQVNALLKISKFDAGTVRLENEPVNVGILISKALSVIAVPMDIKNQTVTVKCEADVAFSGDASWTGEAITNILKNCSEHTPENGSIMIEAQENVIYTEIKIADSGNGIDEQDLPHIFERFYKGKSSSEQSVGIGLALAQMIITAQNGTVKAENGEKGGAVFTVKFYKSVV